MYIYLDIYICRYLRSGPSQLILVLTLLVFIIILQIKKPSISTEDAKEEKKMLLAALPWSLLIVLAFVIMQTLTNDQIVRFLLTSFVVGTIQQIIPLYFMLTLPKLRTFASECFNFFFTHNLIGKEFAFWNYVCCPGKFFTIQLKGTKTNQVLPM